MLTSCKRPCFGSLEKDWFDLRPKEFEFYVFIEVSAPGCQCIISDCTQTYAQGQAQGSNFFFPVVMFAPCSFSLDTNHVRMFPVTHVLA